MKSVHSYNIRDAAALSHHKRRLVLQEGNCTTYHIYLYNFYTVCRLLYKAI
jgi:hypothetical protein